MTRDELVAALREAKGPSRELDTIRGLSQYDAHMLATLPRGKVDEAISTPAACTLTALVPAVDSLIKAVSIHPLGFSLDFVGMIEVAILVGCFAWFLVTRNETAGSVTSLEYLQKLTTGAVIDAESVAVEPMKKRRWWKRGA